MSALRLGWLMLVLAWPRATFAQTVVLYSNTFENPNTPLQVNCGNSLDIRTIDTLYGAPGFTYQQVFTVEGVVIHDPAMLYSDPSGVGGNYALGMLSTYQNDMLGLTFDAMGLDFVNVGMDLSSIDVSGCGGPFGTAIPIMQISVYDTPTGTFDFVAPGVLLDQGTVTGTLAPSGYTLAWVYRTLGLDASLATIGPVTIVFDLLQSGYGAFDNLSIVASTTVGIVDRDTDGVADDQDNCPDTPNMDQLDADADLAGDVCDPLPLDPTICGDIDQNGVDDCAPPPDAGTALDASPIDTGTVAMDASPGDGEVPNPEDTGLAMDASQPDAREIDAATDTGVRDSGVADRGTSTDAGLIDDENGCACSATAPERTSPLAILLLIGLLASRRRNGRERGAGMTE